MEIDMKKVMSFVLSTMVMSIVYGGQRNVYVGDEFDCPPNFLAKTNLVYYKDDITPLARGCLLQNIQQGTMTDIQPPFPTNAYIYGNGLWKWRWYVDYPMNIVGIYNDGRLPDSDNDPGNDPPHPHQDAGGAGSVGTVNGLGGANTNISAGNFKFAIAGTDDEVGWVRAFSGNHWTNSVYYGDGYKLTLPSTAFYQYGGNTICSNINPAYIIQFTTSPHTSTPYRISGKVANIGNGNNQIPYNYIEIILDGPVTRTININSDGTFDDIPGVAGTYIVKARVKNSYTPRPGFPLSKGYTVSVIADVRPFVDIITPAQYVINSEKTIKISGTNNAYVVGSMKWENSANGQHGFFASETYWQSTDIPLAVGINTITITGTNSINEATNDTVVITRGIVGTGTPFVDITNTVLLVSIAQDSYTFAGTNNIQLVGGMSWHNANTGESGTMPATQHWLFDAQLAPDSNVITVSGTNVNGVVDTDTITIQRGMSREVALLAPPDGCVTNAATIDLDVYYGIDIVPTLRFISTNNGATWLRYDNPAPIAFPTFGTYHWTALGYYDQLQPGVYAETNTLTITTARPHVQLLTPANNTILTNTFNVDLVAAFGDSPIQRQFSTNNGASWFDFTPATKVAFHKPGTWYWTARGRNVAGWGYADTTNKLTIFADITGSYGIFPSSPAQNDIYTNPAPEFSVATIGTFDYTSIITNDQPSYQVVFPSNIFMGPGVHSWSPVGTYFAPATHVYAPATNTFEVLNVNTSCVRLLSHKHNAHVPYGKISFDVYYFNVTDLQMTTNNGASWFSYTSPLYMNVGTYKWSARGKNAGGNYVYAPTTNTLYVIGPPDIRIVSPEDGDIFPNGSDTIVVRGRLVMGGYTIKELTLNGQTIDQSDLPNWQHTITLNEGGNMLTAYVETTDGYSAQDSIVVTYDSTLPPDTTPPDLAITSPADGLLIPEAMQNSFDIVGTVDDAIGVATLSVRVEPDMSTPWDVKLYSMPSWNGGPITLAVGDNRLIATAVDFGGNVATVTNIVTVTTVPITPNMVIDIFPDETCNKGVQDTVITGQQFASGCEFYLIGGRNSIKAFDIDIENSVKAYASFTVDNVSTGLYDVLAVNPDGSWGIALDIFTVHHINEITNLPPVILKVIPDVLTNNYNSDCIIAGSNFFNVQSVSFTNNAGYWFRGIDIDRERSSVTAVYCTAMCGSDLAPQSIPRPVGFFTAYVTAINDLTGNKPYAVRLVAASPPIRIEDVIIILSNDYKTITVTWNGPDAVAVYTNVNRYYSPFSTTDGKWAIAEGSATWPWIFDASGTESLYIHLSDTLTPDPVFDAKYDVGKYDQEITPGKGDIPSYNWITVPFILFNNSIDYVFKDMLTYTTGSDVDILQGQSAGFGGIQKDCYYYNGEWNDFGAGFAELESCRFYQLIIHPSHTNSCTITFVGKVPTNNTHFSHVFKTGTGDVPAYNWIGYPAPSIVSFLNMGLDDTMCSETASQLEKIQGQQTMGGILKDAYYLNGTWNDYGTGLGTNCIPGMGYQFIVAPNHTESEVSPHWEFNISY